MGIVSAILALFRAVPSLERLFLNISNGIREAQAQERFNAKLTHIDNAMRVARSGVLHSTKNEWSEDPDRTPPVPDGSTTSTSVDASSIRDSSKTRVRD